jgi:hypothetical protein
MIRTEKKFTKCVSYNFKKDKWLPVPSSNPSPWRPSEIDSNTPFILTIESPNNNDLALAMHHIDKNGQVNVSEFFKTLVSSIYIKQSRVWTSHFMIPRFTVSAEDKNENDQKHKYHAFMGRYCHASRNVELCSWGFCTSSKDYSPRLIGYIPDELSFVLVPRDFDASKWLLADFNSQSEHIYKFS